MEFAVKVLLLISAFAFVSCVRRDSRSEATSDDEGEDICLLPEDGGPCKAMFELYYFNAQSGNCELFIYGGCGGNANRFPSESRCLERCGTTSHLKAGRPVRREAEDICLLPAVRGDCRALIPSYHFNSQNGKCERFNYGGCHGNENRFSSEGKCMVRCGSTPTSTVRREAEDICHLPAVSGECRALNSRYHFNAQNGKCERFNYGGCHGNENRFLTEEKCLERCGSTPTSTVHRSVRRDAQDICLLPAVTGNCRAFFRRYHFNAENGKCKRFIYGGCGGNDNRFRTEALCMATCDGFH